MNDYEDDPLAELFARLDADRPPSDIVPTGELTLADVAQANEMAGEQVTVTIPGEVLTDLDGLPIAVEPSTTTTAMFAGLTITRAEADRLGITDKDYPHVNIV